MLYSIEEEIMEQNYISSNLFENQDKHFKVFTVGNNPRRQSLGNQINRQRRKPASRKKSQQHHLKVFKNTLIQQIDEFSQVSEQIEKMNFNEGKCRIYGGFEEVNVRLKNLSLEEQLAFQNISFHESQGKIIGKHDFSFNQNIN